MATDTKQKLVRWIEQSLGAPCIHIELDEKIINQHIDTAVQMYSKYSDDVTFESAIVLNLSADINEYTLPDDVETVMNLETDYSTNGVQTLFSPMNTMYNRGDFDSIIHSTGYGNSGLVEYELGMEYLEMIKTMLHSEFFLRFNTFTKKLTVTPTPAEALSGVLIHYSKYDVSGLSSSLIYDELWIKEYALALTKITLGMIRGKFDNLPLPDGSSLNYGIVLDSGITDKERLEEKLTSEEAGPLDFFMA